MIEIKSSIGDVKTIKKMKIITSKIQVLAGTEEVAKELGASIVAGETFVFSIDEMGVAMNPVESSTVGHLGWFNEEMFVTFKGKLGFTMYGYKDVSGTRFVDLINATSIGRRFGLMRSESLKDYVRFF
jgi:hypothetical protein